MAERIRVLQVVGIDDTNRVTVEILRAPPRYSKYSYTGNVEIRGLLDPDLFDVKAVVCGGMQGEDLELGGYQIIFNAVCDADTNTKALEVVERIARTLGLPVINHPAAVLATTRERQADALQGIPGLRVPWTRRVAPHYVREVGDLIDDGTLPPPFLFREAGCHGGEQLVLIEDRDQLSELERFAFDGRSFYATEFVDFRSPDGLYRKCRILVVGQVPFPKHVIISDHWNIHAESRQRLMTERPELVAEEDAFLAEFSPADHPALEAVASRLDLDYFGIDCSIGADGTILVFEANGCMRALTGGESTSRFDSHRRSTAAIKAALAQLLTQRARRQ